MRAQDPPPTLDAPAFRRLLGQFATGVAVLTVAHEGEVHATTVNSFTSVSLDPPMVLVCIAHDGRFDRLVRASGTYCVNVLGEHCEGLSNRFARQREGDSRDFEDCRIGTTEDGHPILADCLAHMTCRVAESVVVGDHRIFIGEVQQASLAEGQSKPLIFYRGRYRWLTPWTRTPPADPTGLAFRLCSL